jgi:hypothetical protein
MDPKEIRKRLGLSEDASDEQVRDSLRALNAAVGEEPEPEPEPAPAEPGDEPAAEPTEEPEEEPVATVAASALPPGTVLIDEATLAELRASGSAAMELVNERAQDRREALVNAAIGDGRIPPARKDHWLGYLANDPNGGADALAALSPGLVPVAERGHSHSVETIDERQIEADTVAGWTHDLFPETREAGRSGRIQVGRD